MTDTNTSATLISNAHTYAKGAVALFLARVGLRTALTEREHDLLESMFALAYQEGYAKGGEAMAAIVKQEWDKAMTKVDPR